MKANELRIGNLISFKGLWNGEVSEITEGVISIKGNGGIFPHFVFEPIPLTEEWLVKFGFSLVHKNNKHYFITLSEPGQYAFHVYGIDENFGIAFSDNILGETRDYIPRTSIKYVHELQTLYFALTGEELTIKTKLI